MQPNEIDRCDGARTGTPESALCMQCVRTDPGGRSFIEPAVVMVHKLGRGGVRMSPACHNYKSRSGVAAGGTGR